MASLYWAQIFDNAHEEVKKQQDKAARKLLLEAWLEFEQEQGDAESIAKIEEILPRQIKKRREIIGDDGVSWTQERQCLSYANGLLRRRRGWRSTGTTCFRTRPRQNHTSSCWKWPSSGSSNKHRAANRATLVLFGSIYTFTFIMTFRAMHVLRQPPRSSRHCLHMQLPK